MVRGWVAEWVGGWIAGWSRSGSQVGRGRVAGEGDDKNATQRKNSNPHLRAPCQPSTQGQWLTIRPAHSD
eukprot:5369412-Pyramimonas_sp.AAC.1